MKNSNKKNYDRGFSLVEVLVACTIITTSIFALMATAQKGISLSSQGLRDIQGTFLAEEGAEAVKSIRDANWTNISGLTINTPYYLSFNTTTNLWSLSTTATPAIDSIFTRTVTFSELFRDSNDDIATSGIGAADTHTKKVTLLVTWKASDGTTLSETLVYYLSDIFT